MCSSLLKVAASTVEDSSEEKLGAEDIGIAREGQGNAWVAVERNEDRMRVVDVGTCGYRKDFE